MILSEATALILFSSNRGDDGFIYRLNEFDYLSFVLKLLQDDDVIFARLRSERGEFR